MAQTKKIAKSGKNKPRKKATHLKIRVFENNGKNPDQTVSIPLFVFGAARKLVPQQALAALQKEGIDLDGIFEMAQNQEPPATLLEVEEHKKKRKVVISIE